MLNRLPGEFYKLKKFVALVKEEFPEQETPLVLPFSQLRIFTCQKHLYLDGGAVEQANIRSD